MYIFSFQGQAHIFVDWRKRIMSDKISVSGKIQMKHRNFKKSKGILSFYLYVQKMGGKQENIAKNVLFLLVNQCKKYCVKSMFRC